MDLVISWPMAALQNRVNKKTTKVFLEEMGQEFYYRIEQQQPNTVCLKSLNDQGHDPILQGVPTSLEQAKSNGLKLRNVSERNELRLRKDVFLRLKIAF